MKRLLFFISVLLVVGLIFMLNTNYEVDQRSTSTVNDKFQHPADWMAMQRAYPYDKIKIDNYLNSLKYAMDFQKNSKSSALDWELAGPTNIGGRITDIEITPNEPNRIIYVGAASGGILKSTDEGATWTNIFTKQPTISIGDIAIDPNDENVLYAGTGEANASSFSFFGSGVYKSTNAGLTWQPSGLETSAYIGRIIVDYSNSNNVFVAACGDLFTKSEDRGVYKSTNGGASWEKVLYVSDTTAAVDIVQDPVNPNVLYATMWERIRRLDYRQSFGETSGIWKSSDGGDTWTELTNGLPTGTNVGRIGIDIAQTNPNVLYAFYDMEDGSSIVYKTLDGGNNWTETGTFYDLGNGYGWYFGQIRIDPLNENKVFVMGLYMYATDNGGTSWYEVGTEMHVDHHAMEFDNTTGEIFQGNDGGFYKSINNGTSWSKINNLPITQFYDIAIDSLNPNRLYGGTQDNNSIRTTTGNVNDWEALLGGDGMYTLVDYTDPNTYYCEYQWGGLYRFEEFNYYYLASDFSGDRTNWSTPYVMHPENPNILYLGTYKMYKSTNQGDNWTPISDDLTQGGVSTFNTISSIDISQLNPDIIVVGTCDGRVHITTDGGSSWSDISAGLPDRWVTRVKTDPFDEAKIYVTLSGFRWDEPYSHVYMSPVYGQTWVDIQGDLPDIPVNAMIIDPDVQNRIIVGTDAGIYMTENNGNNWYSIGSEELSNVPVCAMEFHHQTRTLFAGTYGLSAHKAQIPLDPLFPNNIQSSSVSVFEMNIYPNPFISSFGSLSVDVVIDKSETFDINIYDTKGQIVYSESFDVYKGQNSIKLSDWQSRGIYKSGLYFCEISSKNITKTEKFVYIR